MTVPAFIRYLIEMPRPVPAAWPSTEFISCIFLFVCLLQNTDQVCWAHAALERGDHNVLCIAAGFYAAWKMLPQLGNLRGGNKKKQIDTKIDRSGRSNAFIWSCWQYLNKTPFLDDSRGKASQNNHQVKEKTWNFQSWDSVLFWYRRYRYSVLENGSFGFGISVLS